MLAFRTIRGVSLTLSGPTAGLLRNAAFASARRLRQLGDMGPTHVALGLTHGKGFALCSGAQTSRLTSDVHSLLLRSIAVEHPFSSRQCRNSFRGPSSTCVLASERPPPWTAIFDLRERETDWTEGNQVNSHA